MKVTECKTLSLRITEFRDEDGQLIPKFEEDLNRLGVQMRDSQGQILSTFDIITQISKTYKDLDRNKQLDIANQLGGKRQANILSALLNSGEEIQRAYDLASNSANSAMNEFNTYTEGVQYSVDRLKESINNVYTSLISSDFLKGTLEGATSTITTVTSLIDKFGALPIVIATVTGVMVAFNSKMRESTTMFTGMIPGVNTLSLKLNTYTQNLSKNVVAQKAHVLALKEDIVAKQNSGTATTGLGLKLSVLSGRLALTTVALVATKVATIALQTAMSMGLSLLIGGLISAFGKMVDAVITTKSELKELNETFAGTFSETNENIKKADGLVESYKKIKSTLDTLNEGTEEYKNKQSELKAVLDELIQVYPDAVVKIDEDTQAKLLNVDATQKLIEKDRELAKSKANTVLNKNDINDISDVESLVNDYKKAYDTVKEFNEYKDQGLEKVQKGATTYYVDRYLERSTEKYEEMKTAIDAILPALSVLDSTNPRLAGGYDLLNNSINSITTSLDAETQALNNNKNAKDQNSGTSTGIDDNLSFGTSQASADAYEATLSKLGFTAEEVTSKLSELNNLSASDQMSKMVENATTSYGKAVNEAQNLQDTIDKINEAGAVTPDLVYQLSSQYPELGARITDVASVQDFLNGKISDQVDIQSSAYEIMIGDDAKYYQNKLANNSEFQKTYNSFLNAWLSEGEDAYNIDFDNYTTLNQLKAGIQNDLGASIESWLESYIGSSATGYANDFANFKSFAEAKAEVLRRLQNQFNIFASQYNSAVDRVNSNQYADPADITHKTANVNYQATMKAGMEKIQKAMDEVDTNFGGLTGQIQGFSGGGISAPKLGGGSDSSKGKNSSSTAKEVADIEIKTDRYRELNRVLEKINGKLELNSILQKQANDKNKNNLIQQRIKLLNEQRTAQLNLNKELQKEKDELWNKLRGYGFAVDGYEIKDVAKKLKQLESYANSSSGETKEARQEYVKQVQSVLEAYDEINDKKMPELGRAINDITNEIIDSQKEVVSIMQEQLDEKKKLLEEETEKVKTEIQKQKDYRNKQWDEEDFEDNLSKEQKKLAELQGLIDESSRDMSANGKARLEELKRQYEEQSNVVNDMLKDKNRSDANDEYDKAMEEADANLEAKLKELDDKFSEDNLMKLVNSGVFDISKMLDNTKLSAYEVAKSMSVIGDTITNDLISGLDTFISQLDAITSMSPSVNIGTNLSSISPLLNSNGKIVNVSANINVGSISNATRDDFDRIMAERLSAFANDIAYQINKN